MLKKLLLTLGFLSFMGCTDYKAAAKTLHSYGFTSVELTGWDAFECGEGDWSSTGFKATNSQGQRVSGVVCCGLIVKSCTVRF